MYQNGFWVRLRANSLTETRALSTYLSVKSLPNIPTLPIFLYVYVQEFCKVQKYEMSFPLVSCLRKLKLYVKEFQTSVKSPNWKFKIVKFKKRLG